MENAQMIGYVVLALISIIGLFFTVCKPMIDNQRVMTELNCSIKSLNEKIEDLDLSNKEILLKLANHELRIHDLEIEKERK